MDGSIRISRISRGRSLKLWPAGSDDSFGLSLESFAPAQCRPSTSSTWPTALRGASEKTCLLRRCWSHGKEEKLLGTFDVRRSCKRRLQFPTGLRRLGDSILGSIIPRKPARNFSGGFPVLFSCDKKTGGPRCPGTIKGRMGAVSKAAGGTFFVKQQKPAGGPPPPPPPPSPRYFDVFWHAGPVMGVALVVVGWPFIEGAISGPGRGAHYRRRSSSTQSGTSRRAGPVHCTLKHAIMNCKQCCQAPLVESFFTS